MKIRAYTPQDARAVLRLWNTVGAEIGYAPQTEDTLSALLLCHPNACAEHSFVAEESGDVIAYISGCTGSALEQGETRGYLNTILTKEKVCAQALLQVLEESFRAAGKTESVWNYFNPIRLPWIIPGTDGHQHNNLPGCPQELPLREWMAELGYQTVSTQMAMHEDLSGFIFPERIAARAKKMEQAGYTVQWYREGEHFGVDEMVESLHNSMWSAEIPAAAHQGLPLLVGLKGNKVAGFTGPVRPEKTGRGYFAGIAVAPEYEGNGLGTLLFYRLLEAEKQAGARYLSLFTEIHNPAQKIYLGAGFTVVRRFDVLRKAL